MPFFEYKILQELQVGLVTSRSLIFHQLECYVLYCLSSAAWANQVFGLFSTRNISNWKLNNCIVTITLGELALWVLWKTMIHCNNVKYRILARLILKKFSTILVPKCPSRSKDMTEEYRFHKRIKELTDVSICQGASRRRKWPVPK